jgi:hypothetical protein
MLTLKLAAAALQRDILFSFTADFSRLFCVKASWTRGQNDRMFEVTAIGQNWEACREVYVAPLILSASSITCNP